MYMKDVILTKLGQVESVDDDFDGGRIKVRITSDGTTPVQDLPYAFPLLPKAIQTAPKVGECVLVLTAELGNDQSNRYYLGPIISQPQYNNFDPYDYGRGSSTSLLQGGSIEPLERVSNYDETKGSFPSKDDVAIVGRNSEDIVLKNNEIDIRCGIRSSGFGGTDNVKGEVIFNKKDPSYIQLKHNKNMAASQDASGSINSVVNVVADNINLISHKDPNAFNLTDNTDLIKTSDLSDIMSKLHQIPYGDVLIDVLQKMIDAILNHVHPYPGLPPCKDQYILRVSGSDLKSILSNYVRTS